MSAPSFPIEVRKPVIPFGFAGGFKIEIETEQKNAFLRETILQQHQCPDDRIVPLQSLRNAVEPKIDQIGDRRWPLGRLHQEKPILRPIAVVGGEKVGDATVRPHVEMAGQANRSVVEGDDETFLQEVRALLFGQIEDRVARAEERNRVLLDATLRQARQHRRGRRWDRRRRGLGGR